MQNVWVNFAPLKLRSSPIRDDPKNFSSYEHSIRPSDLATKTPSHKK